MSSNLNFLHVLVFVLGVGVGTLLRFIGAESVPKVEQRKCPEPPPMATGTPPPLGPPTLGTWPTHPKQGQRIYELPTAALGHWQAFAQLEGARVPFAPVPNEGIRMPMPPGSSWECVLTALDAFPTGPLELPRPEYWVLSRTLRCSNDRWLTQLEARHSYFSDQRGNLENPADQLSLTLHEPRSKPISVVVMPTGGKNEAKARRVYLPRGL